MHKGTLFTLSLIMLFTGCVPLYTTKFGTPKISITKSIIDIGDTKISRLHDQKTGEIIASTFLEGDKYVPGTEADLWICDGAISAIDDPESPESPECRLRISSTELYGQLNSGVSCGGRPCSYYPR